MKFIIATLMLLTAGIAHADAGYLKCDFDDGDLVMEGDYDGKDWNIKLINEDDTGYGDIKAENKGAEIGFYLDTADATGGDPDYTDIYDITIHGQLKKGVPVNADVEGSHISRTETPFSMTGQCQIN